MRTWMRSLLPKMRNAVVRRLVDELSRAIRHETATETQLVLYHYYKDLASRGQVPRFCDVGFRCHSQFEEDGKLLFIFALLGSTNKTTVEICAGDGTECMSANLILKHGWWGHLFDGDPGSVDRGRAFFGAARETFLQVLPGFEWVTSDAPADVAGTRYARAPRRQGAFDPEFVGRSELVAP